MLVKGMRSASKGFAMARSSTVAFQSRTKNATNVLRGLHFIDIDDFLPNHPETLQRRSDDWVHLSECICHAHGIACVRSVFFRIVPSCWLRLPIRRLVVSANEIPIHVHFLIAADFFVTIFLSFGKRMEHTLELSASPRSAARQLLAFLINSQQGARDSKKKNTEETPETSAALSPGEQCTQDAPETPDHSERK